MKKLHLLFAAIILLNTKPAMSQAGTLDNTFSSDGKVTTLVGNGYSEGASVAIQADGRTLVAGDYVNKEGVEGFAVVRYNSDGSLDNSFSGNGKAEINFGAGAVGYSLAIQKDGKIVVAGFAATQDLNWSFAVARLNANGTLDNSFSGDGKVTTFVGNGWSKGRSVAIQADGKIVVAGYYYAPVSPESYQNFAVVRYNSDGSLDNSFGSNGIKGIYFENTADCYSVAIQLDGKIVVAGDIHNQNSNYKLNFAVARLNSNGTLDNSFSGDGKVTTPVGNGDSFGNSVAIQANGKIVVAGVDYVNTSTFNFALVQYNNDGNIDNSFDGNGKKNIDFGGDDEANSVAIQADGKIVVAGYKILGDSDYFAIARLNSNSTLDSSFDGDGRVTTDFGNLHAWANSVAIRRDGKIVVAGTDGDNIAVARYLGASSVSLATTNENNLNVTEDKLSSIKIYPNPVKNILSIEGMISSKAKTLSIIDITGRVVQTTITANTTYTWNIATLPAGIYNLLIDDKKKRTSLKFVKE